MNGISNNNAKAWGLVKVIALASNKSTILIVIHLAPPPPTATTIPNATPEQLLEGVHATLRQLTAALERNRVMPIAPPAGTKFDPHQHQAISVVPAEQDANTVVAVLQKGYLIADRVLRPALVTVAAPK